MCGKDPNLTKEANCAKSYAITNLVTGIISLAFFPFGWMTGVAGLLTIIGTSLIICCPCSKNKNGYQAQAALCSLSAILRIVGIIMLSVLLSDIQKAIDEASECKKVDCYFPMSGSNYDVCKASSVEGKNLGCWKTMENCNADLKEESSSTGPSFVCQKVTSDVYAHAEDHKTEEENDEDQDFSGYCDKDKCEENAKKVAALIGGIFMAIILPGIIISAIFLVLEVAGIGLTIKAIMTWQDVESSGDTPAVVATAQPVVEAGKV